ncbi:hypothetical protein [Kribbella sp. NPDC004875]|uniref:hypothetical protein n=1 Tax=Kribbella sp. NPDC004875 TaxID=3364107 RepID=UPI00367A95BC
MTVDEDGPRRDAELAAARRVVDVFATEALLALDRYAQSFPADAKDGPRKTADELAHWWRRLKMDDATLGADATDAEQILLQAAEMSLDPENEFGLTLQEATEKADLQTGLESRPALRKSMADFRREFDEAYGGASVPSHDDEWLAASLTRLARAAVLRDVVAEGARVQVSRPLRDAAEQMVRDGQRLIDGHDRLTADRAAPAIRRGARNRQLLAVMEFATYVTAVGVSGVPPLAGAALGVPAGVIMAAETRRNRAAYRGAAATGLDPAQAQLRSVRTDLINSVDNQPPVSRRDTRALGAAKNRPRAPGSSPSR